jgi:2-polyprenyl-6-hydroxyphenyl methylase/3-demethylubiquinone-9 3-methyltransferase
MNLMKRIFLNEVWPDSWKMSYQYDLKELYGEVINRGYAYAYQNRQRHAIEAMCSVAPYGSRILDIAAAQGNFTLALAELGFEVTWNDLRDELADYVALKYENGIVHYAPGNAFELNFYDKFDAVLITEIIEHVAHPDDFLKQVATLVKPNGHIIMTTPNGEYFRNTLPKFSECHDPSQFEEIQFKPNSDGHIFLLHVDEIAPLAEAAELLIKNIKIFTNPLTAGHVKTETLLKFMPRKLVDKIEALTAHATGNFHRKINTHMQVIFQKI